MLKKKNIPFKQFIQSYNFRDFLDDRGDIQDTQIIRIYLNDVFDENDTFNWSGTWFEFGINDFNSLKMKMVDKIFSKEILNSYVSSFNVIDSNILKIGLSMQEEEDDS